MSFSLTMNGMPGLIAPAFATGLLVASTHVPLGREVFKRGIIFMDLAVAQIAGLGIVAASVLLGWQGFGGQAVAFLCAFAAATIFSKLEKKGQNLQEAFIGCSFVMAASLAILIFTGDPHGGEEVSNLMAGQILWVRWPHVLWAASVYLPVLGLFLFCPDLFRRYFYFLFAACITISVQMVGVYLVFASLILPAMATTRCPDRRGLTVAYSLSLAAVAGGLAVSVVTDMPSGPVIVCAYAFVAMAWAILVKKKPV